MKTKILNSTFLVPILALLAGILPAQAQDEDPLVNVRIVTVKQDRVGDWVALQRERTEALKKAGGRGRTVWQVNKGDHNTFHIISYYKDWADYGAPTDPPMGEAENVNWLNDIQDTIQHRRELTVREYSDLHIPSKEGTRTELISIRETIVKHGTANGFINWYRESVHPHHVKHSPNRYVSKVVMGENLNTFYQVRGYESWEDLDKPGTFAKLDREVASKVFTDESRARIEQISMTLLTFREDLSYRKQN